MRSNMYRLLALVLFTGCAASAAVAQPARSFVASTGSDANACSLAAPCRTLQKGIDAVADGGDVLILDSGGFGSNVTITKSVSVYAPPGGQSRLAGGNGGNTVSVNGSEISVLLSGIGVSGTPNDYAIYFGAVSSRLSLRNIDIDGFGFGILHFARNGTMILADSVIRNTASCIISIGDVSNLARSTIVDSRLESCSSGINARDNSFVVVKDTQAIGSENSCGQHFYTTNTGVMILDGIAATGCMYGVIESQGLMAVSNSTFTGNSFAGVATSPGEGRTYGNNRIFGNITDALTGFTPIAEQ